MKENSNDLDEYIEIDDMFVSNNELTYRLERLAKKAGVDTQQNP
jgi:sugar diacid utilization regulator